MSVFVAILGLLGVLAIPAYFSFLLSPALERIVIDLAKEQS